MSWQTCKKKFPVTACGRCQTGMQNRKHQADLDNLMTNVDMDCRAFVFSSSIFFMCNTLFPCTLPGMPEIHVKEIWRKYPTLFPDDLEIHTDVGKEKKRLERACCQFPGSSLAVDAAKDSSERGERIESGGGKKSKTQQRYLNVTFDDLWCIKDKLVENKSSLDKTYKTSN